MAEIAKRLSFNDTGGLNTTSETHGNVEELRRAHQELSSTTRQHAQSKLQEARAAVDNGAGENDLKRLQRKFQATKASYINVDVKERFMQSLRDGPLDIAALDETHKGLEEQLQRDSDALRTLKDQNTQAKQALHDTSAQIATLNQQFEQVMINVAAQLDSLERNLHSFEANRPPPLEPLVDGPNQAECDALLQQEMARAKQLEAAIASSEAAIHGNESQVRSGTQELAALQTEVARLSALQADRSKAADATAHLTCSAAWAEAAAGVVESLGGVRIKAIEADQLQLEITCCVPTALAPGAPVRESRHDLVLQLRPGGAQLSSARLAPATVPIDDIVAASAASGGGGVRAVVGQVQLRLLQYWSLQALVEAAAERFPIVRIEQQHAAGGGANSGSGSGAGGGSCKVLEASLPRRPGVKVQLAVPVNWPQLGADQWCGAAGAPGAEARAACGGGLRLVGASGAGLDGDGLLGAINGDASLAGGDLLGFLQSVAAKVEAMAPV